jgi:hypothetical protein
VLDRLDSKRRDLRFEAIIRFAELGPKAAYATDRLVAILTQFDEEDRVLAVLALRKAGTG